MENDISPMEVTPKWGKGAQDTWRFPRQWGGRLDKTGAAPMLALEMRLWANQGRKGRIRTSVSTSLKLERPTEESRGFKPDPGNLAVRDYRGASGNVAMVGLCTQLAIERAGLETPHLKRGAPDFYPNDPYFWCAGEGGNRAVIDDESTTPRTTVTFRSRCVAVRSEKSSVSSPGTMWWGPLAWVLR